MGVAPFDRAFPITYINTQKSFRYLLYFLRYSQESSSEAISIVNPKKRYVDEFYVNSQEVQEISE